MLEKLKHGMSWIAATNFGKNLLPAKWRGIGTSSLNLKGQPKGSWTWISTWMSNWIGRRKGVASMASMYTILACTVVMLLVSLVIPVDHASVINQVKTTGIICLPHVEEDLDAYHWVMDPDCNQKLRTSTTFCADRGFKPPFQEGQTLKYMRYRRWDECLVLLGGDCVRENDNDPKSQCIRR